MKKRSYNLKQRAERQDQTRQRIIRATMELHGELGPRNTTIKAIAERAGVQRLTVYRHFENEDSLFLACSSLWLELNPPPSPNLWQDLPDTYSRIRTVLSHFYGYYTDTQQMWYGVYRDLDEVPALRLAMSDFDDFMKGIYQSVLGKDGTSERPLAQTLRHALRFPTWASLDKDGINNRRKVDLIMGWLENTAE